MSERIEYGADALLLFPLVGDGVQAFVSDYTPAAGDAKVWTDKLISTNPTALILGFDSLSELPAQGATIEENGAGTAEGVVAFTVIVSGTVGGGDAAGFFFMRSVTGQGWTNNDQIDINGGNTNIATADSTTYDLATSAGLIAILGNGQFAAALSPTEATCAQGTLTIKDATIEDQAIVFRTEGNASAYYKVDAFDAVRGGMTALPNIAAGSAGGLPDDTDSNGAVRIVDGTGARELNTNSGAVALVDLVTVTTTNTDMVGTDSALLASTFTTMFAGITALAEWLGLIAGKQVGNATARTEIRATGAGSGTYDELFDSQEAARDSLTDGIAQIVTTGSAVNVGANAAPNGFTITTGSEVNDEDVTQALDGIRHELTDAAGVLDALYRFDILGNGIPVGLKITGVFNGNNDSWAIEANTGTDAIPVWRQVGTIVGVNGSARTVHSFDLLLGDIVSDVVGEVQIRINGTGLTSSSFDVDQILVAKAIVAEAIGYENGRIYINTTLSNTGTVPGVDGVAGNPVSTIAAAVTLSGLTGLTDFHVINGSSFTLAANSDNHSFFGNNWSLALGGQSIAGAHIEGAILSGTHTGTGASFKDCRVMNVTTADDSHYDECGLAGTLTLVAGDIFFTAGHHAGGDVDFNSVGSVTFHCHGYRGNIEFLNMAIGDLVQIGGSGGLTSNVNNAGGTIRYRGAWSLTDNGSATMVPDDVQSGVTATLEDTTEIGTAGAGLSNINLPDQTMDITGNLSGSVGSVTGAVGSVAGNVDGSVGSLVGHTNQTADHTAAIAAIPTTMVGTDNALLASTFSTMFSGITALAQWLGLIAGKQTGNATARTEMRATGAGSGTFDETTDSQEAIRDTAPLGTAMRGTDSAALASVATEGRLAELDAANLPADVDTLLSRLTSTIFTGMTSLAEWLGLIAGKQTGDATARTELRATGAGSGTFDETSDAQEAIRDTAPLGTAMRGTDGANTTTPPTTDAIRDAIMPTQNTVFNDIEFLWVAASDGRTPVTGATGTSVTRSIDGGAFAAATGTLAEVGNGIYVFDASAADMNGGIITFRFVGTGGTPGAPDDAFVTIVTGGFQ